MKLKLPLLTTLFFILASLSVFSQTIERQNGSKSSDTTSINLKNKTYSVTDGSGNPGVGCFNTYMNGLSALDAINSVQLAACRGAFQGTNDYDGWIECNQVAMDSYFAIHGVYDAAYLRCLDNQHN